MCAAFIFTAYEKLADGRGYSCCFLGGQLLFNGSVFTVFKDGDMRPTMCELHTSVDLPLNELLVCRGADYSGFSKVVPCFAERVGVIFNLSGFLTCDEFSIYSPMSCDVNARLLLSWYEKYRVAGAGRVLCANIRGLLIPLGNGCFCRADTYVSEFCCGSVVGDIPVSADIVLEAQDMLRSFRLTGLLV